MSPFSHLLGVPDVMRLFYHFLLQFSDYWSILFHFLEMGCNFTDLISIYFTFLVLSLQFSLFSQFHILGVLESHSRINQDTFLISPSLSTAEAPDS
jgi:hypothetical protein